MSIRQSTRLIRGAFSSDQFFDRSTIFDHVGRSARLICKLNSLVEVEHMEDSRHQVLGSNSQICSKKSDRWPYKGEGHQNSKAEHIGKHISLWPEHCAEQPQKWETKICQEPMPWQLPPRGSTCLGQLSLEHIAPCQSPSTA